MDNKLVAFFEKESSAKKVTRGFAPRPQFFLEKNQNERTILFFEVMRGEGSPLNPPLLTSFKKGSKGSASPRNLDFYVCCSPICFRSIICCAAATPRARLRLALGYYRSLRGSLRSPLRSLLLLNSRSLRSLEF